MAANWQRQETKASKYYWGVSTCAGEQVVCVVCRWLDGGSGKGCTAIVNS
jgi:hypothetical protein